MSARPDYLACITRPIVGTGTWCGRRDGGWCFTGLDHAAASIVTRGRLVPCPECVAAAVAVLKEGT